MAPVPPRNVSGGSSDNRYLFAGQFRPQPTEVMARKAMPAGARPGRAVFGVELEADSVRECWVETEIGQPPCRCISCSITRCAGCQLKLVGKTCVSPSNASHAAPKILPLCIVVGSVDSWPWYGMGIIFLASESLRTH